MLAVRRPLMVGGVFGGRKVLTIGTTAEKRFEIRYHMPCPALGAALHTQLIIWYIAVPSAVLSASLVPIICTPPSVARPLQSSSVDARVAHGSLGVLFLLDGALLVLVSAGQSPWLGPRGAGSVVCCVVPCFAASVVCALVPQWGCRGLGWPGLSSGVGVSRTARRAGLGVRILCSLAGAGWLVGPVR